MYILFELIIDLLISSSIEGSKSSKIPKPIRYLLLGFVILFFVAVIGLIIFVGVDILKTNLIGGLIIIGFGILMLILSILKFKKIYLEKNNENR